ncbi:hypothetical protein HIM_08483 [Hirsutella minnesotensis 3608]|uniref:FMN hydroxy acid dehydrogenase domain-containing protein n=1 Tax=Hirsutella minnesotensis 3608 TaxID=1043627 RepID=A0A0F7ZMJ3_9HYPO|nr:hypothetical protein HIM_08483 [Hirsutella minnesotensis 3608]
MAGTILIAILWLLPVVWAQDGPQLFDTGDETAPPAGEDLIDRDYAAFGQQVLLEGLRGQLPVVPTDPRKIQGKAKQVMPKNGYDYITGAAGEEATKEANRLAFRQWRIVPRVLTPTTPRNLSVTLFGHRYGAPAIMAPIGDQSLYHPDKEVGTAIACANLSVPFTLSTAASTGIEELVAKAPRGPKWFQLYWPFNEELLASILNRAHASGYQVLVVTLDGWAGGWRPSDLDTANAPNFLGQGNEVGFQDPVFRKMFAEESEGGTPENDTIAASVSWITKVISGTSQDWSHLRILRKHWKGPIVLKGILSVQDARMAVRYGMDGIVVSNHGGRQMDGGVATLDVLPEIVDAVGKRTTVLFDSGLRTGADVFKALALGAKAVLVGRPVVYGLGINGTAGALAAFAGILADLDITMGFAGAKRVSDLTRDRLRRIPYSVPPGYIR